MQEVLVADDEEVELEPVDEAVEVGLDVELELELEPWAPELALDPDWD